MSCRFMAMYGHEIGLSLDGALRNSVEFSAMIATLAYSTLD